MPKLGWLRYRNSPDVLGEVRNAIVSQSSNKWFVSIQTERKLEHRLSTATSAIGVDVGIDVLQRGYRSFACGEIVQSGRWKKQTPTKRRERAALDSLLEQTKLHHDQSLEFLYKQLNLEKTFWSDRMRQRPFPGLL